jgi:ribulose-phosphate 3-epimerase
MSVKVSASILSANFLKLGDELKRAENAGCDYIHVDVMDGNYVGNMAVGLCVAKWLKHGTALRLDAHLAIQNPHLYIEAFAEAGMDSIIFHPESYPHHYRLIEQIRKNNMLVGIALSPSMSIECVKNMLPEVEIIDQLAVDAGFPNQSYIMAVNNKIEMLKRLKEENGYRYEIQTDGGINTETAREAVSAGVDVLVSGTTLFESEDMVAVVRNLKGLDS